MTVAATYIDGNYILHPIESVPLFGGGGGGGALSADDSSEAGGNGGGAVCLQFARFNIATNCAVNANGCPSSIDYNSSSDYGGGGGGGGGFARLLYRTKTGAGTLSATATGGTARNPGSGCTVGLDGEDGIAICEAV